MRLSLNSVAVLEFLTWAVRLATDEQIQTVLELDGHSGTHASRLMRRLRTAGLVHRERIHVGVLDLTEPLCVWAPDKPEPRLGSIAWQLLVRSKGIERKRVVVNWATRQAAKLMAGSSGQLRQPLQAEHDLGTTATYLACLKRDSEMLWLGEDIVRRRFGDDVRKVPDALIINRQQSIQRAIEFGGQYGRRRLETFHRFWKHRNTAWEIW
ncbi:MAG: hypothetical protein AB8G99_07225 [Planctomycetaceae bacterium]